MVDGARDQRDDERASTGADGGLVVGLINDLFAVGLRLAASAALAVVLNTL